MEREGNSQDSSETHLQSVIAHITSIQLSQQVLNKYCVNSDYESNFLIYFRDNSVIANLTRNHC